MTTRASGDPCYHKARDACLWRAAGRRLAIATAALSLCLSTAGCSYSYKLGSLFGEDREAERLATGSAAAEKAGESARDGDLASAKAAAAELLARGGDDASIPWENPRTGARGLVTRIATAYSKDGFVCQDFLASHVIGDKESWYQGGACRIHGGRWEVRDIRVLQRT
jgi:surface antigen